MMPAELREGLENGWAFCILGFLIAMFLMVSRYLRRITAQLAVLVIAERGKNPVVREAMDRLRLDARGGRS